jgi:hypothetical protein
MLVETALVTGHLHAQIQGLQGELARVQADRDAWRSAALEVGRAVA